MENNKIVLMGIIVIN